MSTTSNLDSLATFCQNTLSAEIRFLEQVFEKLPMIYGHSGAEDMRNRVADHQDRFQQKRVRAGRIATALTVGASITLVVSGLTATIAVALAGFQTGNIFLTSIAALALMLGVLAGEAALLSKGHRLKTIFSTRVDAQERQAREVLRADAISTFRDYEATEWEGVKDAWTLPDARRDEMFLRYLKLEDSQN